MFQDKGPDYLHAAMKITIMFNVRSLNLSDNLLTDHHAKIISDVIKKGYPHLEQLYLNHNEFGPKAGKYLKSCFLAIKKGGLRFVDLSHNKLTDSGIFYIAFGMLHYKTKSTWLLQHNKGTKEAWKIILATLTENHEIDIFYADRNVEE